MRHSAIVVSWNAAEVLDRCLASIARQEVRGGLETIVVDNASTDGTAEVLARHAEHVRVIRSEHNLGFSLGNNRGAEAAQGEVLHFLNSDTELLAPYVLERLARAIAEPGVGLAGPRLEYPDGSLQPSCTAQPTVLRALAVESGLHRVLPNALLARVYPRLWSHDETRDMGWLVGAALSIRADLFRALGGFWPIQYAEEQDLARKVEERGLSVRFVHDARVMHVGNVSNRQNWSSPQRAARTAAAERAFLAEHYPPAQAAAIRAINVAGHTARALVLRALGERERAAVYASMARALLTPRG
jgi:GT2 family glycosyltransferase